jgi:hypothetical protein
MVVSGLFWFGTGLVVTVAYMLNLAVAVGLWATAKNHRGWYRLWTHLQVVTSTLLVGAWMLIFQILIQYSFGKPFWYSSGYSSSHLIFAYCVNFVIGLGLTYWLVISRARTYEPLDQHEEASQHQHQ